MSLLSSIKSAVSTATKAVTSTVSAAAKAVSSVISTATKTISNTASAITTAAKAVSSTASSVASSVVQTASSTVQKAISSAAQTVNSAAAAVNTAALKVIGAANDLVSNIVNVVQNIPPAAENISKTITEFLAEKNTSSAQAEAGEIIKEIDKISTTLFNAFLALLPKPIINIVTFIEGLSHENINNVLESLLRLPGGEAKIEALGMKGFDLLVQEMPELEVLRKAPKGSISIAIILGIVTLILGIGTVVGWLRKEAPEPSGMAVWAAIEAEDWETADKANKLYIEFINKMNGWIPIAISWFNPFLAGFINTNTKSQLAGADAYQKIIDAHLAVKKGTLVIRPDPSDSKVSVSGLIPVTGVFDQEVNVGTYFVTVSKFGYISKTITVIISENQTSEFDIKIEAEALAPPAKAKLIISVTPSDAVISVAGYPSISTAGTYEIDPGSYTINFSRSGFESQQRTIFINEGKIETVSVILKVITPTLPPEEVKGLLTITIIPADAVVEIAGQPDIVIPGTYELLTGSYSVKASKEGFFSQTKSAFVSENRDTVVSFILEETAPPVTIPTKATIYITSEPTNSDVYIDGKYTFTKTPYTTVLEAGTYIIRVQASGYYPQEASVTFSEGDEVIIPFILEKIPEEAEPTVTYTPYQPYIPEYQPTVYYTPAVTTTPYSQVTIPDYSLIEAPAYIPSIEPVYPTLADKEILINIETTDLNPWDGKIFSIAWLDLTTPGAEIQVIVDEDEKGILEAFMQEFEAGNYKKIIGYNLKFDYQWIFNKLMLYRIPAKKFYQTDLRDVFQLMSQVKEEFVYNARAYGSLDDYGKELLGAGKLGDQETLLRRYTSGDLDYVEEFQIQQIEVTRDLYQLFRYCASEGFVSSIPATPAESSPSETSISTQTPFQTGQKQCANCLAYNPLNATQCEVCGFTVFR